MPLDYWSDTFLALSLFRVFRRCGPCGVIINTRRDELPNTQDLTISMGYAKNPIKLIKTI